MGAGRMLAGILVAGGLLAGGLALWTQSINDSRGTVVRVVDGDTFVADVGGRETTIRLLNVDTPETDHPNEAVKCLGPEATKFLTGILPAGASVELAYDRNRTDTYGRTLAAVYRGQTLVNAEVARAGLGVAVVLEPNRRYYEPVLQAQRQAQRSGVGFYDVSRDCTVPALGTSALKEVDKALAAAAPTTVEEADAQLAHLVMVLALAKHADEVVSDALNDAVVAAANALDPNDWGTRLSDALTRLDNQQRSLLQQRDGIALTDEARLTDEERIVDEARQADLARLADEALAREQAQAEAEASAQALAEAEAAAQAQADAEAAAKAAKASAKPRATTSAPKASSAPVTTLPKPQPSKETKASSQPSPEYTGRRCYAPGGKTWRPCP